MLVPESNGQEADGSVSLLFSLFFSLWDLPSSSTLPALIGIGLEGRVYSLDHEVIQHQGRNERRTQKYPQEETQISNEVSSL